MKKAWFIALAAATAVAGLSAPAAAHEGCGHGYHRGPYGHCRPDHPYGHDRYHTSLIIGDYYDGRGYWDGRRYWQHRRHDHHGWHYY